MMHRLTPQRARTLLTRTEELLVAIRINKTPTVECVLKFAKDGDFIQDICTAGLAAKERWLDAVRDEQDYPLLLKLGHEKKIPIIEAIKLSRVSHVEMMFKYGFDINILAKRIQETPLATSVRFSKHDLMRMLVETYHADPNMRDPLWQTPIYTALEVRNPEALTYLLDKGANVNNVDSFGETPLIFFLRDKQLRLLDKNMLDILLRHDIDCSQPQSKTHLTPLHVILSNTFIPANVKVMVIERLLEHRADPNLVDNQKRVPLHYVCSDICDMVQKNRCEVLAQLFMYGADPNVQDDSYNTPLHYAAQADLAKVAEVLTENGANPKLRNEDGLRPCDMGCSKGAEMVLSEAMEKWQDTVKERKEPKGDSMNVNTDRKGKTFEAVSIYLQKQTDHFRTSINRLGNAISHLEYIQPKNTPISDATKEDYDVVDASQSNPDSNDSANIILTTRQSVDLIKLEFLKLKSYAYAFQNDYKKIANDLKLHRNCQTTFEYSDFLQDGQAPRPTSYFGQTNQLLTLSEEQQTLLKACHITSTLVGQDWKSLFRELEPNCLIENEVIIKELETKHPGQLREQAYQALLYWQGKNGKLATYTDLTTAIRACSLGAIEQKLEQVIGSNTL